MATRSTMSKTPGTSPSPCPSSMPTATSPQPPRQAHAAGDERPRHTRPTAAPNANAQAASGALPANHSGTWARTGDAARRSADTAASSPSACAHENRRIPGPRSARYARTPSASGKTTSPAQAPGPGRKRPAPGPGRTRPAPGPGRTKHSGREGRALTAPCTAPRTTPLPRAPSSREGAACHRRIRRRACAYPPCARRRVGGPPR